MEAQEQEVVEQVVEEEEIIELEPTMLGNVGGGRGSVCLG